MNKMNIATCSNHCRLALPVLPTAVQVVVAIESGFVTVLTFFLRRNEGTSAF